MSQPTKYILCAPIDFIITSENVGDTLAASFDRLLRDNCQSNASVRFFNFVAKIK